MNLKTWITKYIYYSKEFGQNVIKDYQWTTYCFEKYYLKLTFPLKHYFISSGVIKVLDINNFVFKINDKIIRKLVNIVFNEFNEFCHPNWYKKLVNQTNHTTKNIKDIYTWNNNFIKNIIKILKQCGLTSQQIAQKMDCYTGYCQDFHNLKYKHSNNKIFYDQFKYKNYQQWLKIRSQFGYTHISQVDSHDAWKIMTKKI